MKNRFDCYGIFSPKRGIKKYITLPVYAAVILYAVLITAAAFAGSLSAPLSAAAVMAPPMIISAAEIIFAAFTMMGMAANDSRKMLFLRTIPDMESTVKNAYTADCIRNILLCLISGGLSALAAIICGYLDIKNIIFGCLFAAAMMYITISVGVYIVRRVKKGSMQLLLILEYIWLSVAGFIFAPVCSIILGSGNGIFAVIALIAAAIAGRLCYSSAVKRTIGCRRPDTVKEV